MPEPARERRYALTRVQPGDYLCPSNDGQRLWRFLRYEDGRAAGLLDCGFESRPFWRALSTPMPADGTYDVEALDELAWQEWEAMLPTRRAAIAVMLKEGSGGP